FFPADKLPERVSDPVGVRLSERGAGRGVELPDPEEVDRLLAAPAEIPRVDLGVRHVQPTPGERRADEREETGAVIRDDAEAIARAPEESGFHGSVSASKRRRGVRDDDVRVVLVAVRTRE